MQTLNSNHKPDTDTSTHFPKPSQHKIGPIFPFTFASYLRSPQEDWEPHIICTDDNKIRIDPLYANTKVQEVLRHIHSQLARRNNKHTSHLSIDFTWCSWMTHQDFHLFTSSLRKYFKSLRSVSIVLTEDHISRQERWNLNNSDLIRLSAYLTRSANLKTVKIQVQMGHNVTETGVEKLCRNISKRSKNIESLHLSFQE